MNYGLIGRSLKHSYSPLLHEMIGRYEYRLRELEPEDLTYFFQKRDFRGLNVTIPYKQAVIPLLDHVDESAALIGAVNTIVNRDGILWGYNTDLDGLLALLRSFDVDFRGRKVLILGTGGTCRTACRAAQLLGAGEILPVSRNEKPGAITYETACTRHVDAELLINTTPCGTYPDLDGIAIDPARFPRLQGVADVVYNPLSSQLVLRCRELGIPARGGLLMLAAQAAAAVELFTGSPCPDGTASRLEAELLRRKQNLVFIGMPSSGKTSVGRLTAQLLNRPFVDLDEVIATRAGRPVPDIFSDGEEAFRTLESAAVRDLAHETGLVIATGGGCVLRRENVENLRRNGLLLFLDRPLADLLPTVDRPLADTAEKLARLYRTRRKYYEWAADRTLAVTGGIDATARQAADAFLKE